MLRKMRLPQRDEIEYHRWSVIRWISHCVSWNKSFPAEGYRMQRISIRESCHVFSWFCQLETIDKDVIYKQVDGIYWEQSLNCLVELKGTHRYKNCPVLQRIMPKMRNEGLQKQIVKSWIQELSTGTTWNARLENTRFATFYNAKRCGINIDVFRSYLEKHHTDCTPDNDNIPKSAIVIKSKALWGKVRCLSHLNRVVFFEKCSEAEVTSSRSKHLDPILCLGPRWNMMINDNIDVHNGIANGTTAEFVKAYLKRCKTCSNSNVWLLGILCHGWRSRSAEFEWQDYDRFKGTCDPTQGVQSFQWLRRARKSACRLQWTLPISYSWKLCHNRAQTARKVR
jgi:hypothetical protein